MKKVLVSGASGFIAPHIIYKCLSKGWYVKGIDLVEPEEFNIINHENYEFVQNDVRNLKINDIKNYDYVFHMAFVTNIPNSIKNPLPGSPIFPKVYTHHYLTNPPNQKGAGGGSALPLQSARPSEG